MSNRLNRYKSPGAKRLMLEAQELRDNTEDYYAQPIDDNLFEWHFTVRGPPDTAFDGGYYHGRLSFPTDYPMKPPSIILLTPNGRFETNKKICLSISGHHPETWQPSWSVRTALLALIAFMPTKANRAIGSLDLSDVERKRLAHKSKTWRCDTCGLIEDLLVHPDSSSSNSTSNDIVCRPSTSRVEDDTRIGSESDGQSSQKSSSSEDCRDSSPEPSAIELDKVHLKEQQTAPTNHLKQQNDVAQNETEQQRSNSSTVVKLIFILLSLLILRRFVMVIQS